MAERVADSLSPLDLDAIAARLDAINDADHGQTYAFLDVAEARLAVWRSSVADIRALVAELRVSRTENQTLRDALAAYELLARAAFDIAINEEDLLNAEPLTPRTLMDLWLEVTGRSEVPDLYTAIAAMDPLWPVKG